MNPLLKAGLLLASIAGLLTACSASPKRSALRWPDPSPPRVGSPTRILAENRYLEAAGTNLIRQGKAASNLTTKGKPGACRLNLLSPPARALSPTELVESLQQATAVLGVFAAGKKGPYLQGAASGFFLTASGAFATCRHVLEDIETVGMVVMTRDGRVCPVREVLAVDPTNDVAILQVEGEGFTPLPVAPNVRQGSPVWVLSHPKQVLYTLTTGIVSGHFTEVNLTTSGEITWLNITADFAVGSSGAPVVDEHGAVVGLASQTHTIYADEGTSAETPQMVLKLCVPSSALLNLVQKE